MSTAHRFIILHSKSTPDAELEQLKLAVEAAVTAQAAGQPFTLTLARDEWQRNFERAGGWVEWIEDVVNGRDFSSNEQRYTGFIVAGHACGKATADIARLALSIRKPVAVFEAGALVPAGRVTQVEANEYAQGAWRVE